MRSMGDLDEQGTRRQAPEQNERDGAEDPGGAITQEQKAEW